MTYKYNYSDIVAAELKMQANILLRHHWREDEKFFSEIINKRIDPCFNSKEKKEIYFMPFIFAEAMRAIAIAKYEHTLRVLEEGKTADPDAIDMDYLLKFEILGKEKPMRMLLIYRGGKKPERVATIYIAPYRYEEESSDANNDQMLL